MSLSSWNYQPNVEPDALGDNDYFELKESGKESYSPGASSANRLLMCNWDVRPDFLDDLLGWSAPGSQGQGTIHRVLPDEHPEIANFYAEDATIEGIGPPGMSDNNAISFTNAKVQVNYKPRDYLVLADNQITTEQDRYTSRSAEFIGDYLTLNGGMRFVATGATLASPPGRITTSMSLVYTWHEVPGLNSNPFQIPNLSAVSNCIGRVNSVPFDTKAGNYPVGTVLFVGISPKMVTPKLSDGSSTSPFGNHFWEIQLNFIYRNNGYTSYSEYAGHNYVFNIDPKVNKWDLVTSDGTVGGPRIYQSADLNSLWTLG